MEEKVWPVDSTSTTTKLLEKRRMMYEVKEEFNQAKDEERDLENDFKATESRIRAKDLEVQQDLIKSNQFLQENELKRAKAKKKYEDELKLKRQKEEKIEQLNHEIKDLRATAARLEKKVARMKKYEDFLEKVKEKNPDDFPDISDIHGRYTTLKNSHEDLTNKRTRLEEEHQEIKRRRDQYEKERKDELMELNIDIAVLQKDIEEVDTKRSETQKNVENASSSATEKDLELGRMITAIENLFERCKYEVPKIKHGWDIEKGTQKTEDMDDYNARAKTSVLKLSAIRAYIEDLRDIFKEFEHRDSGQNPAEVKGHVPKKE
jgi:chromosome segregation ATPase